MAASWSWRGCRPSRTRSCASLPPCGAAATGAATAFGAGLMASTGFAACFGCSHFGCCFGWSITACLTADFACTGTGFVRMCNFSWPSSLLRTAALRVAAAAALWTVGGRSLLLSAISSSLASYSAELWPSWALECGISIIFAASKPHTSSRAHSRPVGSPLPLRLADRRLPCRIGIGCRWMLQSYD